MRELTTRKMVNDECESNEERDDDTERRFCLFFHFDQQFSLSHMRQHTRETTTDERQAVTSLQHHE